jgi:hypothetical protein
MDMPGTSFVAYRSIMIFMRFYLFAEFDPNQMFRQFFSFSSDAGGFNGGNSFSFHFG